MSGILQELRRRSVFKVAAAYVIVAWLLVQVIVSIKDPLHLPAWTDTMVIVLLAIGFPIACILAWAYEITPEGIQPDGSAITTESSRSSRLLNYLIVGSLCAVVGFMVVDRYLIDTSNPVQQGQPVTPEKPPVNERPSIVVLPFDNLSDDASQEYFVDGLTDDLITDLAKLSGLFVISRNSAFSYKGKQMRADEIAKELGVKYIFSGSVRKDKDSIRVNAQLVDGMTGRDIWSDRYNRKLTDIFAVQDGLVKRLVAALSVQLTHSEETRLERRRTPEFKAYDLYLKAQEAFHSENHEHLQDSLALYRRSWQADPQFARAYAGYARAVLDVWREEHTELMVNPVALKEAEETVGQALALDPRLAEAHAARALLAMGNADYQSALGSAKQAVKLDPNSLDARIVQAIVNGYAGQLSTALEAMKVAMKLDPRHSPYVSAYYGWALYLNRDFDQAAAVLEPLAMETNGDTYYISPNTPTVMLTAVYAELGRFEEAHRLVEKMLKEYPYLNIGEYRMSLGLHARGEDIEYRLNGLRKAGIPDWPFGFTGAGMERLGHSDIAALINNQTWEGYDPSRNLQFNAAINSDGSIHYLAATTSMSGTIYVKGDELCERFDVLFWGRDMCGPVYRNPKGSLDARDEYILVNATSVWSFSLLKQ